MAFKTLGEVLSKGEVARGLFTVRAKMASLQRPRDKRVLIVDLMDNDEVITSLRERREHFKMVSDSSVWLEKQLTWWRDGIPSVSVATPHQPLEVITGDACPLLVINEEEYVPSILRDIPPVGWLLPGGCPENLEELLHPDRVALREAREELLVGDIMGCGYSFHSDEKEVRAGLAAIGVEPTEIKMISVERPEPNIGDADELVMRWRDNVVRTTAPIFVDPEIASTAATLYLRLYVPVNNLEELRLFDGEVLPNGTALRRPVRLLKKDGSFAALYMNGNYMPVTGGWITETTGRQSAFR